MNLVNQNQNTTWNLNKLIQNRNLVQIMSQTKSLTEVRGQLQGSILSNLDHKPKSVLDLCSPVAISQIIAHIGTVFFREAMREFKNSLGVIKVEIRNYCRSLSAYSFYCFIVLFFSVCSIDTKKPD